MFRFVIYALVLSHQNWISQIKAAVIEGSLANLSKTYVRAISCFAGAKRTRPAGTPSKSNHVTLELHDIFYSRTSFAYCWLPDADAAS